MYFHESVAGLSLGGGGPVYRGVQIGQVESIRLDPANPDQVDVVLNIERGTPIRRGTHRDPVQAGPDRRGVGGTERRRSVAALEKQPGQELPVIQTGPSLVARLDDAFNNIITNVDNLSRRLERLLGDQNQTAPDPDPAKSQHDHQRGGRPLRPHPPDPGSRGSLHRHLGGTLGTMGKGAGSTDNDVAGHRRLERAGSGHPERFSRGCPSGASDGDTFNRTSRDLVA